MMRLIVRLLLAVTLSASGQSLHPIVAPADLNDSLTISQPAVPARTFSVIGDRGAILGYQSGEFEAWLFPIKILTHFRIGAELFNYPVPLDINAQASSIQVRPSETVITYSHATCTVRQRAIGFKGASTPGAMVLFEFDSIRPLDLTFRFSPAMERMWPAANFGPPGAEWVERDGRSFYLLHTNSTELVAAVALPGASPGVLVPYQERARTVPLEFRLHFDPVKDRGKVFPLLMAVGKETDDLGRTLAALNAEALSAWNQTRQFYRDFLSEHIELETPDAELNRALRWAPVAVEQGKVRFHDETALTAGFAPSGDSARPGFGWFFGRDALWSLYAVHSYGDFALSRREFEFLLRRQRADGKIMHEYSQTADLVDWNSTPYFYASADSTPLLVMAVEDYLLASGDIEFLRKHWESIKRAYAFTRAHESGDGIYQNTEGTGWVESWPPVIPHQEIYLAALDQQSAAAISRLARWMNDAELEQAASKTAAQIRSTILADYYDGPGAFYAFSRNKDRSLDRTATIFPSVAWWNGRLALDRSSSMLERWASHEFSTDWGTRDASAREALYDPISYHQGSVWPLFTAWVAQAEYRAGQPLSAYAHLRQNAGLTFIQDLGSVTELLSGDFFEPLGRSSTHQVWSSSMTFSLAVRGLFGLEGNALTKALRIAPQFPASWDHAAVRRLRLGTATFDLEFRRQGGPWLVRVVSRDKQVLCLRGSGETLDSPCTSPASKIHELTIISPEVEVELETGLPLPGARTMQLKALSFVRGASSATLRLEAQGGTTHDLRLRINRAEVKIEGGTRVGERLRVSFPVGSGYQTAEVRFAW